METNKIYTNYIKVKKMSKMSKIVEYALEKRHPEYLKNADSAREHMQKRSLEGDEEFKIPKRIYHSKVESRDMFGCQTLTFKGSEDCNQIVIYLHGGAYVNEIMIPHISFCDRLAKKSAEQYLLHCILLLQTIPLMKPMRFSKSYTNIC